MVVREATFLPSPRAMSAPLVDWARLPQRCCVKDLDPAEERTEQHVGKFFTGQQEPCVASPCAGCLPPAAGEDELRRRETLQNNRNECCWKAGRGTPVNQDKRCCLVCSAHMDGATEKDTESKFAESEDYCCSLVTDSDLHFPPILESQVKSVEQDQGSSSPTRTRTFAQVVSKDFGSGVGVEAEKNCWEETMCSPRPEQVSDQGSSGETCGRDPIDKSDGRYVTRLEFTIKCGYSESGLDKVISRLGLECDKNLLLQELVRNCSGSERLECREFPNDVSHEEHDPKTMSQDRGKLVNAKDEPQTVSHDGGRVVNAEDDPKTVSADRVEVTAVADGEGAGALEETKRDKNLRHIIIDGSNVAMSHGKSVFSCRGIQIAVDWFRGRGHQDITVFVPQWRKEAPRLDSPITDQGLLLKLAEDGVVAFTPARRVKGRRVVCYDDRYILRLAAHTGGVVVSNDNYRDLVKESQEFRSVVEERLLMYTFVSDRFMPPEDPLGRMGPTLDNFLRKQPSNEQTVQAPCPYGRKCTFGTKCKYGHPERGAGPHKMVSEVLKEQASRRMQERSSGGSPDDHGITSSGKKSKLARTRSLQYGEHLGGETRSLVLPSPLFLPEADSCIDSRTNSPPRSSGKTSDYLSEHRKKLEKDLAMAALADARSTSENVISHETRESNTVGQYKVGLDGASVFPVQMSPYSCHHTSLASGSEGRLISGHLLLAKKLSDEAVGSSFFSQEDLSIQQHSIMTSPPLEIHQTNFPSFSNDGYQNRRSSLPDRYHHHQPLYRRVPSVPHHTNNTLTTYASESAHQSANPLSAFPYYRATVPEFESPKMTCPTSETNALDNARYIGQYSVCDTVTYPRFTERGSRPFQNGHPSDKILVPSADFPSGQPDSGSMDPRNSYSGPQHRIPGTGDTFRGDPRYPPCPPFTLQSSTDSLRSSPMHRSSPERASHSDTNHQQYYNPCQPHAARAFHPQHPRTGEGMFSPPPDSGVPVWGRGGTYPNQRVASFHPPQSPHRPLPPPPPPLLSGCDVSRWQLNSPPPMTPLPGPPVQPGCGDSGHPIAVTDPRYPLYLHLCDTFAQHRVQAVMNKYPEVTDLQKLCVCLLSEL